MTSGFDQFIKHTMAMHELSHDAVINCYWKDIASIASHGFLPFRLQGGFVWRPEGDSTKRGEFELINAYFDPVGKHVLSNPVVNYRQSQGMYVINGKLHRSFSPSEPKVTKRELERAIGDIALLAGVFSCCLRTAMDWCPARYLQVQPWPISRPDDDTSGSKESVRYQFFSIARFDATGIPVVDAQTINSLLAIFTKLQNSTHATVRNTILKALNWYRSGLSQESPLNRVLNVVQALESLATDTYKYLPSSVKQKEVGPPVEDRILEIMSGLDRSNCEQKVKKANAELQITTSDKCSAIARWLNDDKEDSEELHSMLRQSLSTRNRIVHGAIHDSDPDDLESVRGSDWEIQKFVGGILVRALAKAPELSRLVPRID